MKPSHSHLGTIIRRVKRSARVNRNADEQSKLYATLPHLFNLAEYMSYEGKDWSEAEEQEAKRLLALANLPEHVDANRGLGYHEICSKLLGDGKIIKIPAARCRRCGKDLSNTDSMKRGLGPICLAKQKEMEIRATAGLTKEDTIAGIDRISQEREEDDEKFDETGDVKGPDGSVMEVKQLPDIKKEPWQTVIVSGNIQPEDIQKDIKDAVDRTREVLKVKPVVKKRSLEDFFGGEK